VGTTGEQRNNGDPTGIQSAQMVSAQKHFSMKTQPTQTQKIIPHGLEH